MTPGLFVSYWLAKASGYLARIWRRGGSVLQPGSPVRPGVSVVIPSRDGKVLLGRLLPSLMPESPDEVIIIDNGSTDDSATWLKETYPGILVDVVPHPLAFAEAVNRGIRTAHHGLVCVLNNDMVLEPGFLSALQEPFARVPGLFASTAQIFFPAGVRREETGKTIYRDRPEPGGFPVWCVDPLAGEDQTWVLYGSGGCTLYDAAKLAALGGFSELYVPAYVEDLDLGWRAWRQGWPTVFCAGAKVLHLHRQTTSKHYSSEQLDWMLEQNYLTFAALSRSRRIWSEELERLRYLSAHGSPAASRALPMAWRRVWTVPAAPDGTDEILDLCSGHISVFPGRAPDSSRRILLAAAMEPDGPNENLLRRIRAAAVQQTVVLLLRSAVPRTPSADLLEACVEAIVIAPEGADAAFSAAFRAALRKWTPEKIELES